MKKITLIIATIFLTTLSIFAQDDSPKKNTSEVIIITEKTIDDGYTKKKIITEEVKKETQVITIQKTNVENQNEVYATKKKGKVEETIIKSKNTSNKKAIDALKMKQEEEIKASKEAEKATYEAERIKLEEKAAADAKRKKDSIHRKYQKENN